MNRPRNFPRWVALLALISVLVMGSATEAPAHLAARARFAFYLEAYKSFKPNAVICVGEPQAISVMAWWEKFPAGRTRDRHEILAIPIEGRVSPASDGTLAPATTSTVLGSTRPGAAQFVFTPRKPGRMNLAFNGPSVGTLSWLEKLLLTPVTVRNRYFKRTEFDVEAKDCCPGGTSNGLAPIGGRAVAAPGQEEVCKADTTVIIDSTYSNESDFQTFVNTVDDHHTVTLDVHVHKDGNEWIDDGTTFEVSGQLVAVDRATYPGNNCVVTQTTDYSARGATHMALRTSADGIATFTVGGDVANVELRTSMSYTGTHEDTNGNPLPCESWTGGFVDGSDAPTISRSCPIDQPNGAIVGTYDEESHVIDLTCTDTSDFSGTTTVTVSGKFAIG